jgi:hypothetical protein
MNIKIHYLLLILFLIASHNVFSDCNNNISITKPNEIYTDNADGTVTDIETNLMWQKCSLGLTGSLCDAGAISALSWQEALEAAQSSNVASYNDWRLPSLAELSSLVEYACKAPAMNTVVFPGIYSMRLEYLTSSMYVESINIELVEDANKYIWFIDFDTGHEYPSYKNFSEEALTNKGYVRLVRGGE